MRPILISAPIIVLTLFLGGCFHVPVPSPVPPSSGNSSDTSTSTTEIDTANWQTYRNEEYGFGFKYPKGWKVKEQEKRISAFFDGWRNVPEGGSSFVVEEISKSLQEFIDEYRSDFVNGEPLSGIVVQEDYILDGSPATRLVGTTAIGLDFSFIYLSKDGHTLLVSYADYDQELVQILKSMELFKSF